MLDKGRQEAGRLNRQQRDILGTLFLALGLLMAFALYAPSSWTGWLGRTLLTLHAGLFGTLALLLPLILLAFSLMFFLQGQMAVTSRQAGALFLIYLIACSLISLFALPYSKLVQVMEPLPDKGLAGIHLIRQLWGFGLNPQDLEAGNGLTGGLVGGLIGNSLEKVAGLTGALIILFAFLITLLVYAFGLSPSKMTRWSTAIDDELDPQVGTEVFQEAADPEKKAGNFFSRLFSKEEDVPESVDPDLPLDLPFELDPPAKGPSGWDSLYDQADRHGDQAGQDRMVFPKPPPGYRAGGGETKPRQPLQGVPYLFTTAGHKALDPEPGHTDEAKPLIPAIRPVSLSLSADLEADKVKRPPAAPKKAVRRHRPEQMSVLAHYQPPPLTLLKEDPGMKKTPQEIREIRELGRKLEETLENFGVDAQIVNYTTGPTITRFELAPGPGIKVSRIVNLSDDIALSLAAMGVRIEAPIPGKAAIGIEIPNKKMRPVLLRSLLESQEFQKEKSPLVAALGRDVAGDAILCDLGKMPHLLIAGATGSGKSVCINSILISILYRSSPKEVRMLMIDPKIVELNVYNGIPHLLQPVVTDPEKAYGVLNYAVAEMERRYRLFADRKVRDIASYNKAVKRTEKDEDEEGPLPYILIVIDELADLMAVTQHQVESAISRLMAKARAVGIHVIIATQRPSVDVITGVIKANIPSRIAFAVASQVDSRTIIDSGGAEKLLGRGDMLYFPLGSIKAIRGQGSFVSNSEVERILSFIKSYYPENYDEKVAAALENPDGPDKAGMADDGEDELLMEALRVVVEADYAAVSLLQRKLQVGYPRAARLVDRLSELGYVGPFEGSKPRKVLINRDQYDRLSLDDGEGGDQDLD